jgi:hypothetical protein
MYQSITSLSVLLFIFSFSYNGAAQKMSKKAMEARITILEDENKNMKKEMEAMKSQIKMLLSSMPRPSDSRLRGGQRPQGLGGVGQVATDVTTMKFEVTNHDFGTIKPGASVTYVFKFTNTGKNPLTITNAKGSCGCTVPKWPKDPILSGAEGEIQVTFNSQGKKGNQHKSITLTANTDPANTRIYVKAKIEA